MAVPRSVEPEAITYHPCDSGNDVTDSGLPIALEVTLTGTRFRAESEPSKVVGAGSGRVERVPKCSRRNVFGPNLWKTAHKAVEILWKSRAQDAQIVAMVEALL